MQWDQAAPVAPGTPPVSGLGLTSSPVSVTPVASVAASSHGHLRGSTLMLTGRILAMCVGFVTQVLIVRYLSKTDYGALAYGLATVSLLQTLIPLGLDRADARFLAVFDERRDAPRLLGVLATEAATVLALGALAGALIAFLVSRGAISIGGAHDSRLLLVLVVLAPIGALDAMVVNAFAVFASAKAVFFRRYVLDPCLRLSACVIVVGAGLSVTWLATGMVVAAAVGFTVYAVLLRGLLRKVLARLDAKSWKVALPGSELFRFATPLLTAGLVTTTAMSLGPLLVGQWRSVHDVADLRAIQPIVTLNLVVSAAFSILFVPTAARLLERRDLDGVRELYWRGTLWITVLTFPVLALTLPFAHVVVTTLFGARYGGSALYLQIMSVGLFAQAATGFNGLLLQAAGRIRYVLVTNLIALAVAVLANVLLVSAFGATGAACALTVTLLVHNGMKQYGLSKVPVPRLERNAGRVYCGVAALVVVLTITEKVLQPSFAVGVVLAAVAVLALFALARPGLDVDGVFPEVQRLAGARRLLCRSRAGAEGQLP